MKEFVTDILKKMLRNDFAATILTQITKKNIFTIFNTAF